MRRLNPFRPQAQTRANPSLAALCNLAQGFLPLIVPRHCQILLLALAAIVLILPVAAPAQSSKIVASARTEVIASQQGPLSKPHLDCLPVPVTSDDFAELREHSPFLRTLNLSRSLILTGVARIEEETIATLYDVDAGTSYVVSGEINSEGWQLVEVKGDHSDLESLTARIKIAGAEVVSIRYDKAPRSTTGTSGARVSTRIGNGTPGGGTGPHGGPDPRVLTPDQLADARKAARDIKAGFQADGYADNQAIPPEVVKKVSQLSVQQRESVNVKMFEYRNRGLGMPERQKIYNNLLDRELRR